MRTFGVESRYGELEDSERLEDCQCFTKPYPDALYLHWDAQQARKYCSMQQMHICCVDFLQRDPIPSDATNAFRQLYDSLSEPKV